MAKDVQQPELDRQDDDGGDDDSRQVRESFEQEKAKDVQKPELACERSNVHGSLQRDANNTLVSPPDEILVVREIWWCDKCTKLKVLTPLST